MIQFNFNRFGKLAKWSLINDRSYYVRSFLQVLVILTLIFLGFTTQFFTFKISGETRAYEPCASIALIIFFVDLIIGPSLMFQSMKSKHDRQTLLMLPASNFEKYLMRYSTWILLLPLYIVAFLGADLVQYLVNVIWGSKDVMFVTKEVIDHIDALWTRMPNSNRTIVNGVFVCVFLFHSLYTLGGTFFRSHKYSWVLTTVSIIVICMVILWLSPESSEGSIDREHTTKELLAWDALYGVWFLVNFWLSYRLFCRQQVIGKFVNL